MQTHSVDKSNSPVLVLGRRGLVVALGAVLALLIGAVVLASLIVAWMLAEPAQKSLVELVDESSRSVVELRVDSTFGSGVIIDYTSEGCPVILTCEHVVRNGISKAQVKFFDTDYVEGAVARLYGFDAHHDVAVLVLDYRRTSRHAVTVRTQPLSAGESVFVIGNGQSKGIAAGTGVISRVDQYVTINQQTLPVVQTTAPINPGNSGGGLFDMQGRLVGLNAYQSTMYLGEYLDGVSYAVSMRLVMPIVDQIRRTNNGAQVELPTVRLDGSGGITIPGIDTPLMLVNGVPTAVIAECTDDDCQPAQHMLADGEVIVSIGSVSIKSFVDVFVAVYAFSQTGLGAPMQVVTTAQTLVIPTLKRVS